MRFGRSCRWNAALAAQVGEVLSSDVEVLEAELNALVLSAQHLPPQHSVRPLRKRPLSDQQVPSTGGPLTWCQVRSFARRDKRQRVRAEKQKQRKRLACFWASAGHRLQRKGHLLVGTWNTRGLRAPKGKDPEGKMRAFFSLLHERKWSCALLTDLAFQKMACARFRYRGPLGYEGKVGVALNPFLAARWRSGGSTVVRATGWYDVPEGEVDCNGLAEPPTRAEFNAAWHKMKFGKRGGSTMSLSS